MTAPVVETERLVLRLPQARDLPAYAAYNATERSRWTGGPMSSAESFRAYASIRGHWEFRGFGMFAIVRKSDECACGLAGPWAPEGWPETEIGWTLWDEADEGQGLAREAAEGARAWAYDALGWETAVSYVHPENARSLALAARLGAWDDTEASKPFPAYPQTRIYRHPSPEALA